MPPRRINPWRMFHGSVTPNWLQRRREISQGAKLAYARLAQFAGKDGGCFPKQETLAAELGVGERTANEYIRVLVKFGLIEKERPGLGMSNRYFFLNHPWIHEGQPTAPLRQDASGPERKVSSSLDEQKPSHPNSEENHLGRESIETQHTQELLATGLPSSLEEAMRAARQLGIEEAFAKQEFYAKKSIGWKDGYGNSITSWSDHLLARWPVEQRKRSERRATGRTPGKRSAPPRQFTSSDYHQPIKDF